MKALSIRQPWASLVVMGHKDVENRSWQTNYRGPLLIHAGLAHANGAFESIEKRYGLRLLDLPRGGIIGSVELVDVVREHPSRWFDGNAFGWVFAHYQPVRFIPMRGRLGLFDTNVRWSALQPPQICRVTAILPA